MDNMIKQGLKIILLGITFLSTSSFATNRWHEGYVDIIQPLWNGTVIIYLDSPNENCVTPNGTPKKSFYLKVAQGPTKVTELGLENIYKTVLTAFTSEKKVQIYFDDTTAACYIDRVLMYRN